MACGCSRKAKAAARGQQIMGYRVYMGDEVIPAPTDAPFFSVPEAKAKVRELGGGTVRTEYRRTA